jgi:hypothetical protein
MKSIQTRPRMRHQDYLAGLLQLCDPFSQMLLQYRSVNGKLSCPRFLDRCLVTSKLIQSDIQYWSSHQYDKVQSLRQTTFRIRCDIPYYCQPSIALYDSSLPYIYTLTITLIGCEVYIDHDLCYDPWSESCIHC